MRDFRKYNKYGILTAITSEKHYDMHKFKLFSDRLKDPKTNKAGINGVENSC